LIFRHFQNSLLKNFTEKSASQKENGGSSVVKYKQIIYHTPNFCYQISDKFCPFFLQIKEKMLLLFVIKKGFSA
jgi:hypothetical protein